MSDFKNTANQNEPSVEIVIHERNHYKRLCELQRNSFKRDCDILVSQVAALRGALESLVKIYINNKGTENQFVACITPPHGTPAYWKNAINALDSTPAEASERVQKLVEALEEVEKMGTYKNNGTFSEDMLEEPWSVIAGNALAEWKGEMA